MRFLLMSLLVAILFNQSIEAAAFTCSDGATQASFRQRGKKYEGQISGHTWSDTEACYQGTDLDVLKDYLASLDSVVTACVVILNDTGDGLLFALRKDGSNYEAEVKNALVEAPSKERGRRLPCKTSVNAKR